MMTEVSEIPDVAEDIDANHDAFHLLLRDGVILCKSVSNFKKNNFYEKASLYLVMLCGIKSFFITVESINIL